MRHRARPWPWRRLAVLLIVLTVAGLLGGIWELLRIQKIQCQTQLGACPNYYLPRLDFLKGQSWLVLPNAKIVQQALSSYVEITDVKLSRTSFLTLLVKITLSQPFGVVNGFWVDNVGRVLVPNDNHSQVNLQVPELILPGQHIDPSTTTSLQILQQLGPGVRTASLSGSILNLQLADGPGVTFDTNSMPSDWLNELQLILKSAKISGKMPLRVDLRFNNPIMVFDGEK